MNGLMQRSSAAGEKVFRLLVGAWRWPSLFVILSLTVLMLFFVLRVRVESGNASMVSANRELQANYDAFREAFGDDSALLLGITRPDLLRPEGVAVVDRMTRLISSQKGVARVLSLTTAVHLVSTEFGSEAVPLVARPITAKGLQQTEKALEQDPDLARLLLSRDGKTGILMIDLAGDAEQQGETIAAIEDLLAAEFGGEELHLTGVPLLKLTVSRLIQRDQRVIIPFSVLTLGLLLFFMFRRLTGVLLPVAVMGIGVCWTIGLYSLCGYALNTITALLPPVLMVISIATTVHLYSAWLQLAGRPGDPKGLLAAEMRDLFLPCLFTAITTALGLASLTVSDVPAVRLFGAFSAVGVMLCFAVNILVVPAVLSFLPIPAASRRLHDTGTLRKILQQTAELTVNRPRLVLASLLSLGLLALLGVGRIDNNTDLVRFLKSDARLHRDTLAIDRAVGGVNRVEFMLARRDGRPLTDLDDVTRLNALQGAIDRLPNVSGSFSIVSVLSQLNRAEKRLAEPGLPENGDDLLALFDLLEVAPDQELLRKLISADFTRVRLSVATGAIGTADTARVVARIEEAASRDLGPAYTLTPTGEYYQVVSDSNRLVKNVVKSFSLSLGTVFLAIFLLFQSGRLLALALAPNLIPLAWTAGLMAFAGIDLSTGTAMIASVSIGLTVDSSIHYLARYRKEFRGDCKEAVLKTTMATGRAVAVAALVLFFGFSVGGLSSFLPTVYFSVLTGITMLGAAVCALLVLPASLVLADARKKNEGA